MLTPQNTYIALLLVQALHLLHHRVAKRHISFAEVVSAFVLCVPPWAPLPAWLLILVTWQRVYRARGLQVIGVTYPPTNRTEVSRFVRRINTNYPIVLGRKEIKALFYEGETLPITVVIDREGNVRETIEGIFLPEEFEEKIRPLLEQSNATGRITGRL